MMISSDELCHQFRKRQADFTRKSALSFARLVILMMSGNKYSLQNSLNKFFKAIGEVFKVPSASAYCQARKKVQAQVYQHLTSVLCEDFYKLYEPDKEVYRWHGHRLLGADGTYLRLPDTDQLREEYAVHTNQYEGGEVVQGLAIVLHDLLNDIGVASVLEQGHSAEKSLLFSETIWGELKDKDVLVLDRNSSDYSIIAKAVGSGVDVIIRCQRQTFKVVNEFWESEEREQIVKLPMPQTAKTRRYVKEEGLATEIEVRLLKFKLASGEEVVILTTLCDWEEYQAEEFYEVYGWRWRDETFYDRMKNIFEVERFSGQSKQSVEQDFYGVIFLMNLESVLSRESEMQMQMQASKRKTKTKPKVNKAVSYVAMVTEVAELLSDNQRTSEETLREIKHLISKNSTRERPGRSYPRKKLKATKKLSYHRYKKRVTA